MSSEIDLALLMKEVRLVMSPGKFFVARVGSGRVSHLWLRFEFGKFPPKISNFSIFGKKNLFWLGQKVPRSKAGRPLIHCGSKVSSGWVGTSNPLRNNIGLVEL